MGRAGSVIVALAVLLAATPAIALVPPPVLAGLLGPILGPIVDPIENDPLAKVAGALLEPVISTVDQTADTVTGLGSDPVVTTTVPVTTTFPVKLEPTVPVRPDPTLPAVTTTTPLPTTTAAPRPTPHVTPARDFGSPLGEVALVVFSVTATSSLLDLHPEFQTPAVAGFVAQPQPESSHLSRILDFVGGMKLVSFLAAPLLALEVLLRALASAGEGLLAPFAMLVLLAVALRRDHRISGTKTP